MKGIILAGGTGSRLFPLTKAISKQLLPVYDKPMIYYPISTLIMAGITKILIISTPQDLPAFKRLLGDGSRIGIKLSYAEQIKPEGIAQAFVIGKKFISDESIVLILGDNIFYGQGFNNLLQKAKDAIDQHNKASIFAYNVVNPSRYGVVEFDSDENILSIQEKPENPKSKYAVSGLYFYPNSVVKIASKIKPSKRGELEITSVNNSFLKNNKLVLQKIQKGCVWLDTGTIESLAEAGELIKVLEKRQGYKIGCIEESALEMGLITKKDVKSIALQMSNSEYGNYLLKISR